MRFNHLSFNRRLGIFAAGLLTLSISSQILAQSNPPAPSAAQSTTVTFVVPWAAGGGTDRAARLLAPLLAKELGAPVQVENRTGDNGIVGHQAIAQAPADGSVVGMVTFEISNFYSMGMSKLRYTDYSALSYGFVSIPSINVAANSPYKSLPQLLDAIKSQPGKLRGSGSGIGSSWHMAAAGLLQNQKIPLQAIEWRASQGAKPALEDLVAGKIDFTVNGLGESQAFMDNNSVLPLAQMFGTPLLGKHGKIPTLRQAINSDFEMFIWASVVGPKGMPFATQRRIADALKKVYGSQQYREGIQALGAYQLPYETPLKVEEFMRANEIRNAKLLKGLGLAKQELPALPAAVPKTVKK
jgi:tripartite-type tricarboxylate transporter receptor subunit TctC